jgi:hypothetical protein
MLQVGHLHTVTVRVTPERLQHTPIEIL